MDIWLGNKIGSVNLTSRNNKKKKKSEISCQFFSKGNPSHVAFLKNRNFFVAVKLHITCCKNIY